MLIVILELIESEGIMAPFIYSLNRKRGGSANVFKQEQLNGTSRDVQDHGQQKANGFLTLIDHKTLGNVMIFQQRVSADFILTKTARHNTTLHVISSLHFINECDEIKFRPSA